MERALGHRPGSKQIGAMMIRLALGADSGEEDMAAPVTVAKFQVQSHTQPDEVRTPSKTRVEVVHLEGFTIGRFTFAPGWRWSECIKPVVKTDHCQVSHVGYAVSGRITVRLKDGTEKAIGAGDCTQSHRDMTRGWRATSPSSASKS